MSRVPSFYHPAPLENLYDQGIPWPGRVIALEVFWFQAEMIIYRPSAIWQRHHGIITDPDTSKNDPDDLVEVSLDGKGTHRFPQDCLKLLED